ncbi:MULTISPECIES: hypothetical protein [Bosea]|jgi:hypothetical protein|uniref:Uncharacterized protein n=1 Tax=Bosea massiliensis TaxID=151419 RepID=A0ABW0P308_9HYPH|nr:hypothetical protein [Bosea sp. (in: a-proteobacteria)]MDP3409764.1 hypothetical protein [Bosea sp. (in: a-proteobacteria)]
MSSGIAVRDGSVYLPAPVVETYLQGVAAVVVLIRDQTLMVLPVHHATAGGCLLKQRNAAGDRVAQARDVFQAHGLLAMAVSDLPVHWNSEMCALCAPIPGDLAKLVYK